VPVDPADRVLAGIALGNNNEQMSMSRLHNQSSMLHFNASRKSFGGGGVTNGRLSSFRKSNANPSRLSRVSFGPDSGKKSLKKGGPHGSSSS